eukprot:1159903-Pelagomonas_calceolata.AAC.13
MQRSCWGKDGKAYIAVPAHEGCSAGAKKVPGTQEALLKGWGSSAGAHPHPCIMCGVGKQTMLVDSSWQRGDRTSSYRANSQVMGFAREAINQNTRLQGSGEKWLQGEFQPGRLSVLLVAGLSQPERNPQV